MAPAPGTGGQAVSTRTTARCHPARARSRPGAVPAADRPAETPHSAARAARRWPQDGYQIGEEHPEVHESDAMFEARAGPGTGGAGADAGPAVQPAAGRLPAARRVDHALRRGRPLRRRRAVHRNQRRVPRLPVHPDRQRPPAAGVSGARRQGPDERGAAQRHLVPPAVRAGPHGHRQRLRGRRPRRRPRADHRPRRPVQADHAPRDGRRASRAAAEVRHARAGSPARSWSVTGAAQGIGEQTARRINAEGGTLVLADRSELVKELADELAHRRAEARWPSPSTSSTGEGAESPGSTGAFGASAGSTC